MNELISIVIAAHNSEKYISECLHSILSQTYENWEVWICDDASQDRTRDIIKEFALKDTRIHVIHNDVNLYAGSSRNKCIENCRGDYIAIQDADDVSEKNRLEVLLSAIIKLKCDFVSSGHYLFDSNGIYKKVLPKIINPQPKDFLIGIPFCHAATLFTKDCLVAVNGYRVSHETRRGQDYDLFMRLYSKGYKGVNVNEILYGYRVDRTTISRRKFKYRLDECIIRYKGFRALGLMPKGLPYVLKPIPAYFLQLIRKR